MAIRKAKAGFEDIAFGFDTIEQFRKDRYEHITEINSDHIPYSDVASVKRTLDWIISNADNIRDLLEQHEARVDNPHQVQFDQTGAAAEVHTHLIAEVLGLQSDLDQRYYKNEVFNKGEHIVENIGASGAGLPIVLDSNGAIHPTLSGSGLYFVGEFEPTAGAEYPDTSSHVRGAFWMIQGVGTQVGGGGYTFTGGDLVGRTVYDGDLIIFGEESWTIQEGLDSPSEYYRLDGTQALTAHFQAGNFRLTNVADGLDPQDVVTIAQITPLLTSYMALNGTTPMAAPLPMGGNRLVDLAPSSVDTDGVNRGELNAGLALKAAIAGAGFTGPVTVPGGATNNQVARRNEIVGSVDDVDGGERIDSQVVVTQAEYDALTPVADRLYFIVG